MPYPSLEQYNEVLQHPNLALVDPTLKRGTIATTGLGLPLAMCGGFALTYTLSVSGTKFAVRCFHKESKNLEQRYAAISRRLKSLSSNYFLDFEFQRLGVRVGGSEFPIVRMAWASGDTLATFVESNLRNKGALDHLTSSLSVLSVYLSQQNIAHGDIQPENLMVSNSGNGVQLIDYDGMYVDELKPLGSTELGQRNFQHPGRTETTWSSSLDRFAFIALNFSLRILQAEPFRWSKTQSDQSAILFRAGDYRDPQQSAIFQSLFISSAFGQDAKNFAAICKAAIEKTPTLEDFFARRNIPAGEINVISRPSATPQPYVSAHTVVAASNYAQCAGQIGNQVELIGCIAEVSPQRTRRGGRPYVFINFGHWTNDIVKINIWSEGLARFKGVPSGELVGKWVSVIGLMEPPYVSKKYRYSHLSITILQPNQLRVISDSEARFRLASSNGGAASTDRQGNRDVLERMTGRRTVKAGQVRTPTPLTSNQAILERMVKASPSSSGGTRSSSSQPQVPSGRSSSPCFVATAVYEDSNHPDVVLLRRFRDQHLARYRVGRRLIALYDAVGPRLARYARHRSRLKGLSRSILTVVSAGLRGLLG
jgi:hypothetical protein